MKFYFAAITPFAPEAKMKAYIIKAKNKAEMKKYGQNMKLEWEKFNSYQLAQDHLFSQYVEDVEFIIL